MAYFKSDGVKRGVKITILKEAGISASRTYNGINILADEDDAQSHPSILTPNVQNVLAGFDLLFPDSGITIGDITKREIVEIQPYQFE